jgi:hypothetical protein
VPLFQETSISIDNGFSKLTDITEKKTPGILYVLSLFNTTGVRFEVQHPNDPKVNGNGTWPTKASTKKWWLYNI